jgi:hypothetical protein
MMSEQLQDATRRSKDSRLAKAFSRLGWAGLLLQVVLGSVPIAVMAYYFAFSRSATVRRSGFPFIEYLTIANLLVLLFTIFWSYRYTRLARQIADPELRPTAPKIARVVWTGVAASTVGMLLSLTVILIEAAGLLFFFLRAPQGGIPVVQTSGAEAVYWVSSVDMVSLMALIVTLFAELIVLVFSLWLLFRTTSGSPAFPHASGNDGPGG